MTDYQIEILRYPTEEDWRRCKTLALNTVGKKATENKPIDLEWKRKILTAGHSPVRTLMFTIRAIIPYYVSVHFSRHKVGTELYVKSQRNDRQYDYDRKKAPQDIPVSHIMDINAQALINMSHKRLCGQADEITQEVMLQICQAVKECNPEFSGLLEPECEFRNGYCPEFYPCGKKAKYFQGV